MPVHTRKRRIEHCGNGIKKANDFSARKFMLIFPKAYSRIVNSLKTLLREYPFPALRGWCGKIQQKQSVKPAGIVCGNTLLLRSTYNTPTSTRQPHPVPLRLGLRGRGASIQRNQILAERFHRLAQLLDSELVETLSRDEAWAFVHDGQLALGMNHWGPKPGEAGCLIAAEVMEKYGNGRAAP